MQIAFTVQKAPLPKCVRPGCCCCDAFACYVAVASVDQVGEGSWFNKTLIAVYKYEPGGRIISHVLQYSSIIPVLSSVSEKSLHLVKEVFDVSKNACFTEKRHIYASW